MHGIVPAAKKTLGYCKRPRPPRLFTGASRHPINGSWPLMADGWWLRAEG